MSVRYSEPGGIIWKVLPDDKGRFLVIESRDAEKRKTMVSVLSIAGNSFLYHNVLLPKPWWIGLKAVGDETIVFQGYKEGNTPDPEGIYVLDLKKGNLLWKEENKLFYSYANDDSILLTAIENEELVLHNTHELSGKVTEIIREDVPVELASSETHLIFPLLYSNENTHYTTLAEFIHDSGYECSGHIEYLEYKGKHILSFYVREGKKMKNILLLVDEEGEIQLEDQLSEDSEGVGLASFFICKETLIYIKKKTSIALVEMI